VLTAMAVFLVILVVSLSAWAGEPVWDTYVNARFHFALKYPKDLFLPLGESANRDGQRFVSRDGQAVLTVFGAHNSMGQSLKENLMESKKNYDGIVTYELLSKDWYELRGLKNGRLYYQKTYLTGEVFKSFIMEYPLSQRGLYERVAIDISRSFRVR